MDTVIVFSDNLYLDDFNGIKIKKVFSKEELAHALVTDEYIRCIVAEIPEISDEYFGFFNSVKINFPMLEGVILTPESDKTIHGFSFIDADKDDYKESLKRFINNAENRNKRGANRFSWPLKAWFSENDIEWNELEIFSVSSGGAYLKTDMIFPGGGSRGKIRINFANFSLESECEVIDSQSRSSNYPFGFSIKFTSLTNEGKIVLDNLVNDAVIRILMEPEAEPEIPSLGGSDLTPDFTFF